MDNSKYTTAEEIMSMVNSVHKNKPTNITDFINWCSECEVNVIKEWHYKMLVLNEKIKVYPKGKVKIPCNVYRVIKLKDSPKDTYNLLQTKETNGSYIFIPDDTGDLIDGDYYVYMDYEGLPVDAESGLPLILKGHELACQAYCVKQLFYEDYLNNNIDENRWRAIQLDLDRHVAGSSTGMRHVSHADKEKYFQILFNLLQDVTKYRGL